MAVEYSIIFDDEHTFNYRIELEREPLPNSGLIPLSSWTALDNQRCINCPLDPSQHKTCPAAADLQSVVEDFKGLPAFKKAKVHVRTNEREYSKLTNLEEAIRSLLGVIMATSACPILNRLKPMAYSHLPFASEHEFTLRTVSMYVMREFFHMHEGKTPDWQLSDLTHDFKDLQLVNQALWHRIHDVCAGDTNLKVLLSFFSMSSSMTYSLETKLQKIRSLVVNDDNMVAL